MTVYFNREEEQSERLAPLKDALQSDRWLDLKSLPIEMREARHFISSSGKVPIDPATGSTTSVMREDIGVSLQEAFALVAHSRADGVGIVLRAESHLSCIDLDNCIGEDGQPSSGALTLLNALPHSYVEVSRSGSGLHFWIRCETMPRQQSRFRLPDGTKFEFYQKDRFIVVTGSTPRCASTFTGVLLDSTVAVTALLAPLRSKPNATGHELAAAPKIASSVPALTRVDWELIDAIAATDDGDRFMRLWRDAELFLYDSASAAEMAISSILWPRTDFDLLQTARITANGAFARLPERTKKSSRWVYYMNTARKSADTYTPGISARYKPANEPHPTELHFRISGNRGLGSARHTAAVICSLFFAHEERVGNTWLRLMRIDRQTLATHVGVRRETISKHLTLLAGAGLITKEQKRKLSTRRDTAASSGQFYTELWIAPRQKDAAWFQNAAALYKK